MARARWSDGNRREFQNGLWPVWAVLAALAWVNVVLPLFYYSPLPRGAVTHDVWQGLDDVQDSQQDQGQYDRNQHGAETAQPVGETHSTGAFRRGTHRTGTDSPPATQVGRGCRHRRLPGHQPPQGKPASTETAVSRQGHRLRPASSADRSGRFADRRGLIRSWSTLMAEIVLPLIRVAHTDHNAGR